MTTEVFVICNQLGHFWGKSKTWVDGSEARAVARMKHRDEASNVLFELSSKDFELRGDVTVAQLNSKGDPEVKISHIPLPEIPLEEEALEEEAPESAKEVEQDSGETVETLPREDS